MGTDFHTKAFTDDSMSTDFNTKAFTDDSMGTDFHTKAFTDDSMGTDFYTEAFTENPMNNTDGGSSNNWTTAGGSVLTTPAPDTTEHPRQGDRCVRSCESKSDGFYQSCATCNGYVRCLNHTTTVMRCHRGQS